MPPPSELQKRPPDGISRVQKVAAVELGFRGALGCLGVRGYIEEEEVRRWSNEGPTRVEGAPPPPWPPRLFLDAHSKSPGSRLLIKSRSRRFHSVWTPFDIPFLRNPKIGKKTTIWAGPPIIRLVQNKSVK